MRLIDADKIIFREIDEIGGEYEPYLGCSKSQIGSLPTVTPQVDYQQGYDTANEEWLERMDKIRAEIGQLQTYVFFKGDTKKVELADVLEILGKYDTAKIKNEMADIGKELRTRFDKYKADRSVEDE